MTRKNNSGGSSAKALRYIQVKSNVADFEGTKRYSSLIIISK